MIGEDTCNGNTRNQNARNQSAKAQGLTIALALGLALALGCGTSEQPPPVAETGAVYDLAETNKETMRRFVAAMNARDLDALDDLVSGEVVRHSPSTPGLEVRSLEQFKAFLQADFEAVPDSVQEIRLMVAEGDRLAVWANYSGTQTGQMGPFPPTGKQVDLDFAGFLRLEDGKITEIQVVWDNLGMLVALGHLEPPGAMF